ncbi:hypothetical protein ABZ490_46505 [Streptomyces sp. NPDC005811]|uniref:hypothetical protein n=1 Tax=Streptomyces sp. NPDC005811 TaxID=3154565 RepID=UPI0033DFD416
MLLPVAVRWARFPRDTSVEEELLRAGTAAAEEAFRAIPHLADELGTDPQVVERLRHEYEIYPASVRARGDGVADDDPALRFDQHSAALRLALVARKRATVVRLRDEQQIDDTVRRRLQAALDIEEVRLAGYEAAE